VIDVPLSVLDLAPVAAGQPTTAALRATTQLARRAEQLGYTRFWVGEHHNTPAIASAAPAVLVAHLAAHTDTIRVGAGGVLLPNHAPLVVAEQFGTLHALHPGRIDLGIGRAPGTDEETLAALRRTARLTPEPVFPDEVADLIGYFTGERSGTTSARPGRGETPALWLLGSSAYSARLAGQLGLPFAFAHHLRPAGTVAALDTYRREFRPSAGLAQPYTLVSVTTVCADTDSRAHLLARPAGIWSVRRRQGRDAMLLSASDAADQPLTDTETAFLADQSAGQAIGSPRTVRRRLAGLLAETRADELMLTNLVADAGDRIRSLELVMHHRVSAP
jgi:luciferase family oxidoreductase group 1